MYGGFGWRLFCPKLRGARLDGEVFKQRKRR
jgi:hypothetical protein